MKQNEQAMGFGNRMGHLNAGGSTEIHRLGLGWKNRIQLLNLTSTLFLTGTVSGLLDHRYDFNGGPSAFFTCDILTTDSKHPRSEFNRGSCQYAEHVYRSSATQPNLPSLYTLKGKSSGYCSLMIF